MTVLFEENTRNAEARIRRKIPHAARICAVWMVAMAFSGSVLAQTVITAPKNKYSVEEDVKVGREAAAAVEREQPILHDDDVTSYVATIGERLVAAVPADLQHPEFQYSFKVVNVADINAFALPGGPMYVNRGMLDVAHSEGEIAGVMAHELAHVALRHGTAQATAATKYEVGEIAGSIIGAIIGGRVGSAVSRGSQLGIGISFLRFSREYEKQADLLGAQMMARAGYDPIEMANVFRTIEEKSGGGGVEFLSDHPNPGNRIEYITAEAQSLRVEHPVSSGPEFERMQAHLRTLPPPKKRAKEQSQR
jgi:predicted Zn-dependent protease